MKIEIKVKPIIIALGLKEVLELKTYKVEITENPTGENLLITDRREDLREKGTIYLYRGEGEIPTEVSIIGIDAKEEEVQRVVEETKEGKKSYTEKIGREVEEYIERKKQVEALEEREREIYRLLEKGLTNREVAARLYLSEKTIKNQLTHIYRKLKITGRKEIKIIKKY